MDRLARLEDGVGLAVVDAVLRADRQHHDLARTGRVHRVGETDHLGVGRHQLRRMRVVVSVVRRLVQRHDAIAAADFLGGVEQQQGRRIARAQRLGGADHADLDAEVVTLAVVAVVAGILAPRRVDHRRIAVQIVGDQVGAGRIVLVEAAEHVARPHDRPALARLALQAAHIDVLADGAAQARFLEADHVRRRADLFRGHHAHVLQEHLQLGQRDRRHRLAFAMHARLQAHARPIDEGQVEHIAGVDQVRVAYLRVGLPDLRPQPRLGQELGGDVPERVAPAHGIAVGMIGP